MSLFLCLLLLNSGAIRVAEHYAQVSGRVLLLSDTDADRLGETLHVPPGMPPVLSFRYTEGLRRHGFGDLDLVVDDAGH